MRLTRIENVFFYLVSAGFLMPILPNFLRNFIIAALLLISIYGLFDKNTKVVPDYKLMILGSLLYITYLVSLFYTENLSIGLRKIETGASLILIPLIFSFIPENVSCKLKDNLDLLFRCFIFSTAFSFLVFWLYFWEQYQMTLFIHFPTVIDEHLGPYTIHAIYLSMHGAISLLFSLYLFSRKKTKLYQLILIIIADIVILLILLILVKKGPILSLIISGAYLAFSYRNKTIMIALGALCVIFISVISFNTKANEKFSELLRLGEKDSTELTSTNIRLTIYSCVNKAIPEAGLFGYGIGDTKSILLDCYSNENEELVRREYNSHNQYLSILLRTGYMGLFSFALFIIFIIVSAYRHKAFITISILLFYLLVMFSENILERENGVVYFCFFISFLYSVFKTTDLVKPINEEQE
ncbi:O-antigen ligase family protein [Nonlabens sp. Ci31]|uniref:O-antigen ligase family protein n=1 Tax=Nonlabens sp. Ci31 TaxID=2608253 RepID=UPI001463E55A|nr:O-antigen ligase family protein [Nonlabens sp. Ci31]QJP33765.1 O-antigen ligase family protein [Nonlabens sp. Ci31]